MRPKQPRRIQILEENTETAKRTKVMLIVKRSNPSSKTFAVLLLTAPKHNSYLNPPQFCSEQKDEIKLVTSNKPKRAIII